MDLAATTLPSVAVIARARNGAMAALMKRVAAIEGRVGGTERSSADPLRICTGWADIDAALGGGIPRRGVHEWWQCMDRSGVRMVPIDVFIHLAWQALLHDEQHCPGAARYVAWVGRAVWPRPQMLVRGLRVGARAMFGAPCPPLWPDARLVDRSLFVDADDNAGLRLWAIEQAVRCPGVCAVIADGEGFDLPATRRLQLAASSALLLLARPRERRTALSACTTRWSVRSNEVHEARCTTPRGASNEWTNRMPAEPAWIVELERAKGASSTSAAPGTRACITRAWEREGIDIPPAKLVAEAARRRARKITRMAAQAAEVVAQRRKEEDHEPAANYPMLPGHRADQLGGVVRPARRARRTR